MTTPAPFTCDLSVDELLLIEDAGWEPVSVVSGDCSYNPGSQASSRQRSKEFSGVSRALASGQSLAVTRMRDAAARAGGQGVVGVRLETFEEELHRSGATGVAGDVHHFAALGTAVRRTQQSRQASARPGTHRRAKDSQPFTSHLSGQQTWALISAGYIPLGLVFGFSVYHAKTERRWPGDCAELPALTTAVYTARELAMGRMQAQAAALGAAGVVGVTIELGAHGATIRFMALGTAITDAGGAAEQTAPTLAVELGDAAGADRRPGSTA